MIRDQEIAWAAGLFEGEGCICAGRNDDAFGGITWIATLSMSDEDVVRRFHDAVGGIGRVHNSDRHDGRKPLTNWRCAKQEDLLAFLALMLPYMGTRRLARALQCLDDLFKMSRKP
jgi:hypothetical protein